MALPLRKYFFLRLPLSKLNFLQYVVLGLSDRNEQGRGWGLKGELNRGRDENEQGRGWGPKGGVEWGRNESMQGKG